MARLPDFAAWAIFAKVAETGSFSRAGNELGLSKATVSKAVSRLEAQIGAALLHRTSRRLALSELGRAALPHAGRLLADAEAAEAEALSQAEHLRGVIRLAAPMSFGVGHLAPILPEFLAAYPDVAVDLHLSDAIIDLVGSGFDMALRIAELADSTLMSRRLCGVRLLLVGTPAYFARNGRPAHPAELTRHACLGYAYAPSLEGWRFVDASDAVSVVSPDGPLRANNGDALMPAVLAGLGLAVLPEFLAWDHLNAGRVEIGLPDWSLPPIALHLLTPPGVRRPARVRALIDFAVRRLSGAPWATVA